MSFLLIVAGLFATLANVAAAEERVVFTQLIHRHGSRSPLVPVNASILCPAEGCGALNAEGIDMLTNLGTLVRTRYSTLNPAYFPTADYDYNAVYSRSTSVPRTLQSADSMLRGLFPTMSTNYPVIYTVPKVDDTLLLSDSWPNLFFYMQSNLQNFYTAMEPQRKTLLPDATVAAMAQELSLQGYCQEVGFTKCVVVMYDVAAAFEATGTLPTYASVAANWGSLKALGLSYFKLAYAWDANKPSDVLRGSPGQPLAQGLIANMQQHMQGSLGSKFIHYSAHDSTVSPLGVTIGDASDEVMRPGFGVMLLLDLVEDGGSYYVKGIKGTPEQTPGPHNYTTSTLKLGGINTAGTTYYINSTITRIPFGDFVRFVDATKPTSSLGNCAVPSEDLTSLGCWAEGAPSSTLCTMYRTNCMSNACPTGYRLDFSNLACVAASTGGSGEVTLTAANAGVMAMCTTFGGMLLGAGAMFAINFFNKKKAAAAGYQSVQQDLSAA